MKDNREKQKLQNTEEKRQTMTEDERQKMLDRHYLLTETRKQLRSK